MYFGWLKKKIKNKAHPEGSMAEAYLVFEISQFSSYYFSYDVSSMRTRRRRNEDDNDEP